MDDKVSSLETMYSVELPTKGAACLPYIFLILADHKRSERGFDWHEGWRFV